MINLTTNIKKKIFDMTFMLLAAIFLVTLNSFDLIEEYIGYALIPLIAAYQIGQYSERKYKK